MTAMPEEKTIRKAVVYGPRDLRLEEEVLDVSKLGPDELYVETEVSALSTGTDLGNHLGDSTYVPGAPDYPRPVGYSNVGVVRKTGGEVVRFRPGHRVFSGKPHQSAYVCRQGELLIPVPAGVSPEEASLAYLTELGLAALRQARYETGENVAVVGLGVIGLATIGLARAMGARVVGIANSELRAEAARKLGAYDAFLATDPDLEEALRDTFRDVGLDIVILTANPWEAYRLAVEIVRPRGRVAILGFPGRAQALPDFNPLDPRWLYAKQLTLLGSGAGPRLECSPSEIRFNLRRNLEYILDLMASGALSLGSLITHRLPAERMQEAYELAREHSKSLVAAVFDWRSEG